jgi:hypothetical protein
MEMLSTVRPGDKGVLLEYFRLFVFYQWEN